MYRNFFKSSDVGCSFFKNILTKKQGSKRLKKMQLCSFENLLHSWGHLKNLINKLQP